MKSTTLYLIRHGLTDWNVNKLVQGQHDISLNEVGLQQARQLGDELRAVNFDAFYSSTLSRTYQTAMHLSDEVVTDDRLMEMCYGKFEGMTWGEFCVQVDGQLKERERLPLQEKIRYKLHETVESYHEVYSRAITCLDEIAQKHLGQKVAVVTHGGLMKSILSILEARDPSEFEIENVGYVVLKVKGAHYTPIDYMRIKKKFER